MLVAAVTLPVLEAAGATDFEEPLTWRFGKSAACSVREDVKGERVVFSTSSSEIQESKGTGRGREKQGGRAPASQGKRINQQPKGFLFPVLQFPLPRDLSE